jgi:hypothetical protein
VARASPEPVGGAAPYVDIPLFSLRFSPLPLFRLLLCVFGSESLHSLADASFDEAFASIVFLHTLSPIIVNLGL